MSAHITDIPLHVEELVWNDEWRSECMRWWGKALVGRYAHYCSDWDYLPIDERCDEAQTCMCFGHRIRMGEGSIARLKQAIRDRLRQYNDIGGPRWNAATSFICFDRTVRCIQARPPQQMPALEDAPF